jgi:hypothetical protein
VENEKHFRIHYETYNHIKPYNHMKKEENLENKYIVLAFQDGHLKGRTNIDLIIMCL